MNNEKITALVIAAQNGNPDALNDLFNETYNDIYYFAIKTLKSEDLACDITQDTFVAIIDNLQSLKEPAAFMGWAKKIAYSKCTRYFNKKKDVLVEEDENGNSIFDTVAEDKAEFIPDEALDQAEFKRTIHGFLDSLSEEQRSAIMMYYFDELSVREIAEIQGVSEGTVKSRLNYGRKTIKDGVEDYEKKHNIKLHAIPFFPFFGWLFKGFFQSGMPHSSVVMAAEKISAATGVSLAAAQSGAIAGAGGAIATSATATTTATAAATTTMATMGTTATTVGATAATVGTTAATAGTAAVGLGAKIAALPLATKIIAAITAVAIAAGGTVAVVTNLDDDKKSSKKKSGKNKSESSYEESFDGSHDYSNIYDDQSAGNIFDDDDFDNGFDDDDFDNGFNNEFDDDFDNDNWFGNDSDDSTTINGIKMGKYMFYSVSSMPGVDLSLLGMADSYIELRADGTVDFYFSQADEHAYGTFDPYAKTMTIDGDTESFTVSGDTLVISEFTCKHVDSLYGSSSSDNNSKIAGTYYYYSPASTPEEDCFLGVGLANTTLHFDENGNFIIYYSNLDRTVSGTYNMSNCTITAAGKTVHFYLMGNFLALTSETSGIIYISLG